MRSVSPSSEIRLDMGVFGSYFEGAKSYWIFLSSSSLSHPKWMLRYQLGSFEVCWGQWSWACWSKRHSFCLKTSRINNYKVKQNTRISCIATSIKILWKLKLMNITTQKIISWNSSQFVSLPFIFLWEWALGFFRSGWNERLVFKDLTSDVLCCFDRASLFLRWNG